MAVQCGGQRSKQSCALCRHNIKTIQYSVRADDDYLECSAPLPKVHLDYGLQGEPELIAPEHSFPPEVWAAFLQLYPRKLRPLLQWLQREIGRISGNEWWDIHARQSIILSFLCMHRLNEAIFVAAESRRQQSVLCEEAYFHHSSPVWPRTQQNHWDTHATEGQEDSPTTSLRPAAFHEGPPAWANPPVLQAPALRSSPAYFMGVLGTLTPPLCP